MSQLVSGGWQVTGVGRRATDLIGLGVRAFEADFSSPSAVQATVLAIGQESGPFDWYVYAAGDILVQPVQGLRVEDWQKILNANLNGAFYTAQASLALLGGGAAMAFVGAQHERMRLPGLAAYAAAKAGLEALAEVLRKETRRKVLVVRPGAVRTAFWQKVPFKLPPSAMSAEELAEKLLLAYEEGAQGVLDL
jgi:NAD(P)-dependent dehydrogenase (short-subunit alcohol dehydrogenase family)